MRQVHKSAQLRQAQILELLAQAPATIDAIATATSLCDTAARWHLGQLIRAKRLAVLPERRRDRLGRRRLLVYCLPEHVPATGAATKTSATRAPAPYHRGLAGWGSGA